MSLTVLVNGPVMVLFQKNDRPKTKVKEGKHKTTTKEEKEKTKKPFLERMKLWLSLQAGLQQERKSNGHFVG